MKRTKLYLLTIILFATLSTYAQENYAPDTSMSLDYFRTNFDQPKDEIWVADFWASWCGPCIKSMPYVKKMHQKYQDKGVKILSVSIDKKEDAWTKALNRIRPEWTQIRIPGNNNVKLKKAFPFKKIPAAYIILKDGTVKTLETIYDLDNELKRLL